MNKKVKLKLNLMNKKVELKLNLMNKKEKKFKRKLKLKNN